MHEGDQRTRRLVFPVVMTTPSTTPVTVRFMSADGTATAPKDYARRKTGTVLLRPGQTRASIEITVKSDLVDESDEYFSVRLTAVRGAEAGTVEALGTFVDDDPASVLARLDVGSTDLPRGTGAPVAPVALTVSRPVRPAFDVSYQVLAIAPETDPVVVNQGSVRVRANQVIATLEVPLPDAAVGAVYEVRVIGLPAATVVGCTGFVNIVAA